jgi:pre-mRNA-splicing factor SYF1
VDLEESIGTVETTKAVYDKILELRIANAQIIINYAAFLEENKYFEDSFKVNHFIRLPLHTAHAMAGL